MACQSGYSSRGVHSMRPRCSRPATHSRLPWHRASAVALPPAYPAPLPAVDAVALESTYGDRQHPQDPPGHDIEALFRPVLERRGTILVPSFAVARAQLVTVVLRDLISSGRLPEVPIHIDSPMALDVLDSYNRYLGGEDLDEQIPGASARSLFPRNVQFHRTPDDSKALNDLSGPRIIISASGMLTGGRILHHLKRLAPDSANLICLVGYQAAGTRGRKLMDGASTIRIHGWDVPVRAKVGSIEGFSAHADSDGLYRWATSSGVPSDIFLVHGEPEATAAMAQRFRGQGVRIHRPEIGDEYAFNDGWRRA
ncbi:MAG: MBL fold metallo-hydrolase [Dehalococcoidia bacterium]|nr:MBL fold metallo-hydrolase [Dehalococcoidia bacterium]